MSEDKNLNHEEEVSLDGSAPQQPIDPDGSGEQVSEGAPKVTMQQHESASIADIITPTMGDEDVFDAVLGASDKLIPWEEVTLPSKGLYYNWTSGVINVRAWGMQTDKILATQRMAQTGQSIDYVLRHCCKFPDGFDPINLLVGDQIFLLYYLRGITHGNMYEFIAKSPETDIPHSYVMNLNDLAETIQYADASLGQEPFELTLPYLSKRVGRAFKINIRMLRVKDSQSITRAKKAVNKTFTHGVKVKNKRKMKTTNWRPGMPVNKGQKGTGVPATARTPIEIDDTLSKNLEHLIVSVMGVTDRSKIRQLVNQMHASDTAYIREWLADNTPGIETTVELTDPETGEAFSVMLPITEGFFRPQNS